jgi:hypothetical protein
MTQPTGKTEKLKGRMGTKPETNMEFTMDKN